MRRERIRIRTQVSADEPTIPSLFDLWPGSEYLEREAFDMFGITFADHPDMSRVLMPEDWVGILSQGLRRRRHPRPVQGSEQRTMTITDETPETIDGAARPPAWR